MSEFIHLLIQTPLWIPAKSPIQIHYDQCISAYTLQISYLVTCYKWLPQWRMLHLHSWANSKGHKTLPPKLESKSICKPPFCHSRSLSRHCWHRTLESEKESENTIHHSLKTTHQTYQVLSNQSDLSYTSCLTSLSLHVLQTGQPPI